MAESKLPSRMKGVVPPTGAQYGVSGRAAMMAKVATMAAEDRATPVRGFPCNLRHTKRIINTLLPQKKLKIKKHSPTRVYTRANPLCIGKRAVPQNAAFSSARCRATFTSRGSRKCDKRKSEK